MKLVRAEAFWLEAAPFHSRCLVSQDRVDIQGYSSHGDGKWNSVFLYSDEALLYALEILRVCKSSEAKE